MNVFQHAQHFPFELVATVTDLGAAPSARDASNALRQAGTHNHKSGQAGESIWGLIRSYLVNEAGEMGFCLMNIDGLYDGFRDDEALA